MFSSNSDQSKHGEHEKSLVPHKTRCILRLPEVQRRTGYKRTHIYNLMKLGQFPQSFKIGIRAIGWDSDEVDRWVAVKLGKN